MGTRKKAANNARAWNYGELTVDDIVDRALRLIEREGVDKLTMRRLAEELGMSSMVTYYYVSSKNEMLDLVIERVWEQIPTPGPEAGDWRERIRELSLRVHDTLIRYRGLGQIAQTRPLAPGARAHADFVHQLLLEAGMDETLLYPVSAAVCNYIVGSVAIEVQARACSAIDEDELAARFKIGLDVMLEGISVLVSGKTNGFGADQPGAGYSNLHAAPMHT